MRLLQAFARKLRIVFKAACMFQVNSTIFVPVPRAYAFGVPSTIANEDNTKSAPLRGLTLTVKKHKIDNNVLS